MSMYQIRPTSRSDVEFDLPICMYKLANIHSQQSRRADDDEAHQNWQVYPEVKALQNRQDEIMRQLYELEAVVSGLTKMVNTPDVDLDAASMSQASVGSALSNSLDLDQLLRQDCGTPRDIVINANPAQPPLSLLVLHSMLCQRYSVLSGIHMHSSVFAVPPELLSCLGPPIINGCSRQHFQLIFTIIWKDVPRVQLKFNTRRMCTVEGEGNVARFLYRLLLAPAKDPALATVMDSWVDTALFQLAEGCAKEQKAVVQALNFTLTKNLWLAGPELSLADVLCACWLMQTGIAATVPIKVHKWLESCENSGHFCGVYSLLRK
ncbi:aminoacyl tRNA synthase complex-interacting multifunctional protein 2 [Scleropages formosus]|uniref:Aminoacyl tRNA synthetase complex interacting multifunctional protein 2 n=1 Tax=Scleropages formosus TaxID=113540 RepID=A0A8C9SE81_SCLFO|nr:aminoacyl tRNA synthase complex-interacting multifunctional protein 2 [Scleropages formosus]